MLKNVRLTLRKESLTVLTPDQAAGIRAAQGGVRVGTGVLSSASSNAAGTCVGTSETTTSSIVDLPTAHDCM